MLLQTSRAGLLQVAVQLHTANQQVKAQKSQVLPSVCSQLKAFGQPTERSSFHNMHVKAQAVIFHCLQTWHLAGLIFAAMAVISLVGVMPAAHVADHLGRKWTILPSCLGLAAALCIMARTGEPFAFSRLPLTR